MNVDGKYVLSNAMILNVVIYDVSATQSIWLNDASIYVFNGCLYVDIIVELKLKYVYCDPQPYCEWG